MEKLNSLASSGNLPGNVDVQTIVRYTNELTNLTTQSDTLTQTLHTLSTQLTQLQQLLDKHQSSALAVALRKLNSSFLRIVGEREGLRGAVRSVGEERDEAWRVAEELEKEVEELRKKIEEMERRFGSPTSSAAEGAQV